MTIRCVPVLSLPRSGSSAVAGALHRMGVDMGKGHLQKADRLNPQGYYEDLRFQRVNKALAGWGYNIQDPDHLEGPLESTFRDLVRSRCREAAIWGFKGPRAAWTMDLYLPHLAEICGDVRMVIVRRARQDVVDSFQRHSALAYGGQYAMDRAAARALLSDWDNALQRVLDVFDGPTHTVDYGELLARPGDVLDALEAFTFEGMEHLSQGTEDAKTWIQPDMRNVGGFPPTIVIPTLDYGRAKRTAELAAARAGVKCETVISVDPGSDGFVKTANRGASGLNGYICLLNDDCEPADGWLATLIEETEKRQTLNVWFAGPSGPCRTRPQNSGRKGDRRRPRVVGHVAGFCLLIRPGVFDQLGGMDESFVHYAAEVDLQWRARRDHNAKTIWIPNVYVDHELHPPREAWWEADQKLLKEKWR